MDITDTRIMGNEATIDYEIKFIQMCGLNYEEYLENPNILTREILEKYFYDLNFLLFTKQKTVRSLKFGYQTLGRLMLKVGAEIPEEYKNRFIKSADWDSEAQMWEEDEIVERKRILEEFVNKIRKHRAGDINPLSEDLPKEKEKPKPMKKLEF